jgi:hypothetical protein
MAGLKKNGDPAAAMGAGRGGNKKGVRQQTGRQKNADTNHDFWIDESMFLL